MVSWKMVFDGKRATRCGVHWHAQGVSNPVGIRHTRSVRACSAAADIASAAAREAALLAASAAALATACVHRARGMRSGAVPSTRGGDAGR